jgi:hypothetical protein
MNFVIGLILLFLLLSAIRQFARMDARTAARIVRHGGGVLGLIGAVLLLLRGRVGFAAALAGMAASFAGWRAFGPGSAWFQTGPFSVGPTRGRVSTARSATIEMRLDHDSGVMAGSVLAGSFAGRAVESLSRPELMRLRAELERDDPDGVNLLEAYLDRRFPGWRDAEEDQAQPRGVRPGAMSRREAYEVLGLREGATPAEIIRAHRMLMKKFHPDHGGSTALAARVNQAKDVLMQRQG